MDSILTQEYYGNTPVEWLIAFGIVFASVILARLLYWVFSRVIRIFTAKSKTKFDDILVDMIEEPAVYMVVVIGIWIAIKTLELPPGLSDVIGRGYQVICAVLVGWLLSRLFTAISREYLFPLAEKSENDLDDLLIPIVTKGVNMIIWALAIVIGLNNAGYDVAALIAGLGIGGLALAMAAKDTVSNIFGGFTIFTDKPFHINDRIKISGYDGTVQEIGIRSTRLKTLDGRVVTIPNSKFAESPVENISWEPSRKVKLDLGLTYDTSHEEIEKAMEILKSINENNTHTEQDCVVSFNAFGDFAMNVMFIYYIVKGEDIAGTQSEVNLEILRQFNDAGLDFAFPTQTLYNIDSSKA
jgi:MscS family membrane protein